MSNPEPSASPVLGLLSLLPNLLIGALRKRLELFASELKEEAQHCVYAAGLLVAAACIALLALASFTAAILLLCSPTRRPLAAAGFGFFYALITALLLIRARQHASATPFQRTIEQLSNDIQIFNPDL